MSPDPTDHIPTSCGVSSYCYNPSSRYIEGPVRLSRRFWQFVHDRLTQAADWVYDNKL